MKILLALVGILAYSTVFANNTGNLAVYQDFNAIAANSGWLDAFAAIATPYAFADWDIKKGKVIGRMLIQNIKMQFVDVNLRKVRAIGEPPEGKVHYEGLAGEVLVRFEYVDEFTLYNMTGAGYLSYDILPQSKMEIQYGHKDGKPVYNTNSHIELKYPPRWNVTNLSDERIQDDFRTHFAENKTGFYFNLSDFLEVQIKSNLQNIWNAKANAYQPQPTITSAGIPVTVNMSIIDYTFNQNSMSTLYSAVPIGKPDSVGNATMFNQTLGNVQGTYQWEFFYDIYGFGLSRKGNYEWLFNATTLKGVKGFDFKAADLWMIFPESRADFPPSMNTEVKCQNDKNQESQIDFNPVDNLVEASMKIDCELHVFDINGTRFHIFSFQQIFVFTLDFLVTSQGKGAVRIADTRLHGDLNVTMIKSYKCEKRERDILQALIREGTEVYDTFKNVFGSGFPVAAMEGGEYQVFENNVTMAGDVPDPVEAARVLTPEEEEIHNPFLSKQMGIHRWRKYRKAIAKSRAQPRRAYRKLMEDLELTA